MVAFKIVIDEERKAAGWGNHFAVIDEADPGAYLYVGDEAAAGRRFAHLNRPTIRLGPFVGTWVRRR